MAISTQISRLTTLRNSIRTKLIGLGILPSNSTSATLSECYNVLSSVTGLSAMSYTPTTTAQTIASGQYLSGAQTINAIPSAYIIPTGTSNITSNSTYDITSYANVSVNVPIPPGYIIPSGTITLSSSGTFDVGSYASADVTVTGGPSKPYVVYNNGYASVSVYLQGSTIVTKNFCCNYAPTPTNMHITNSDFDIDFVSTFNACAFYRNDLRSTKYSNGLTLLASSIVFEQSVFYSAIGFNGLVVLQNASFMSASTGLFSGNEVTHFSMPEAKTISIAYETFYGMKSLESLYLPKCEKITGYIWINSTSPMSIINLPSCSIMAGITSCSNIISVNAPLLKSAVNFNNNSKIKSYDFPLLSQLSNSTAGTFSNNFEVSYINIPLINEPGRAMFYKCSSLTTIIMSSEWNTTSFTAINASYMFYGCKNLKVIPSGFTNATTITASSIFDQCNSLSYISFSNLSILSGRDMFRSCYNLISLFFLGGSVCQLGNTIVSMFSSTPVSTYSTSAGRWASIFVPSSLLASYKAATNWTTISSKIFAYEDYFS